MDSKIDNYKKIYEQILNDISNEEEKNRIKSQYLGFNE